ncbi:MAG: hypothetical protein PVG49_19945 [Desulfobacteraceae bacterium]
MNTRKQEFFKHSQRLGPWIGGAVGIVLLSAGLIKASNLEFFMIQIKAYGIITHPVLLLVSAWGLVTVQCCLGTALLVVYRPRIALPATALLWLVLVGGAGWAAWSGATDECGCFGSFLKHSPAFALVENLILLTVTLYAYRCLRKSDKPSPRRIKGWAVGIACVTGVFLPLSFGVPLTATVQPESGLSNKAELLEGLSIQGAVLPDTENNTLLLVLMGTDCLHCRETLPELDALAETESIPPVLALCADDETSCKKFVSQFQPSFPLGRIDRESFWRLLSTGDMPRVLLVRNGSVLSSWDKAAPTPEEIQQTLTRERQPARPRA